MSAPKTFLRATLSRLFVRLGDGLTELLISISDIAKDTPSRLRTELDTFYEEVLDEIERIENESESQFSDFSGDQSTDKFDSSAFHSKPQIQIDRIRSKLSGLNRKVEDK